MMNANLLRLEIKQELRSPLLFPGKEVHHHAVILEEKRSRNKDQGSIMTTDFIGRFLALALKKRSNPYLQEEKLGEVFRPLFLNIFD